MLSIALRDLSLEGDHLLRELAGHVGTHSLSLDHTRKCAKKCIATHRLGQSLTIMTDYSIILRSYLTPTTSVRYIKPALHEIFRRHEAAGVDTPKLLYCDNNCCSQSDTELSGSSGLRDIIPDGMMVRLDSFHLQQRLNREVVLQHVLCNKFKNDLQKAIFIENSSDCHALMSARAALGILGPPTKHERTKYIFRRIPPPKELRERITTVVEVYAERDAAALQEWEAYDDRRKLAEAGAGGWQLENPPPGTRFAPLLTSRFYSVLETQWRHMDRGCLSDCLEQSHAMKTGEAAYRGSSTLKLNTHRCARGSSGCENFHSQMAKAYASSSRVSCYLYNLRLLWLLHRHNRRACMRLGLKVPNESLTPRSVEALGSKVVQECYEDFRLASVDYELPKLGYEYCLSLDDLPVDLQEVQKNRPEGVAGFLEMLD